MNAAQVRAKARKAVKRRTEEVEADELEGGEINLIPYLDIVTNVMIFLLATLSAGFVLGQINTTLPNHVPANSVSNSKPNKKPNEQPLQIVVSITQPRVIVWSVSGLEGTLKKPKLVLPRLNKGVSGPAQFDFHKLNDLLYGICKRRWGGKPRKRKTYQIILQAGPQIPYGTIIEAMDNMRRRLPKTGMPGGGFKPPPLRMPRKGGKYDPDKNPLFPDILFAQWEFE